LLLRFAAATLLIAGQYAQFGMEELPNRLNYCIDDLNLYKRDTDARIRKLLIDDYQMLNRTVSSQLSDAGHEVVERVKKLTGANVVDVLMNISRNGLESERGRHPYGAPVEYRRMQHTLAEDLQQCRQDQVESVKAMCHKAAKALESMTPPPLEINMVRFHYATLEPIIRANIPQLLANTNRNFDSIQNRLQTEIDKKVHSSQEILKRIADDLFVAAETISTQIRQVSASLCVLLCSTIYFLPFSKTFSLVITSVIMLIAFCFLLGLFYGICGRRPTFYNDDCCVRTTGGRFYSCGIWMTVVTFTALFALATTLFFIIGNTSDLVCRTLRDPLSRPDMISLGERYLEIVRSKQRPDDVLVSIMGEHSLADLIRSCQRNETLYEMFHLDKKYQLKRLKQYEKDAYERLERFLNTTLTDIPKLAPMDNLISKEDFGRLEQLATINMSGVSHFALAKVFVFDLFPKNVLFQDINTRIARPLRVKLETLLKNLTRLNKRLFDEMQVPISALLRKLQHAQALLSDDLRGNVEKAAREQLDGIFANLNQYIDHVKFQYYHTLRFCFFAVFLCHALCFLF
uniref:Prominin-like protein n=1 Tax=Heligmosomoides polygyrus TaxID=6339 RepID=A0A183FWT7_HELPZ